MSGLVPMKITGFTDEDFKSPFKGDPYTVMINPTSLKWSRTIEYTKKQAVGTSAPSQEYQQTPVVNLNFEIIIDCTGVVDPKRTKMSREINILESIVYKYNGKIHRPNYVRIQWGENLVFDSVLKSFDTTYTLFRPDGTPLRAKIALSFGQYVAPKKVAKKDACESPDLSHFVRVIEGETLPQLCARVWQDQSYYIKVAQFNDLNKFRNLKGGQQLIFPPIIQTQ